MKKTKKQNTFRWKLAGIALVGLVFGALLMFLSIKIARSDEAPQASTATAPATTAPAATAPAAPDGRSSPAVPTPAERAKAAAQSMSGLLLMISLLGFAVTIICIGWIVVNIHQSRPAWKTQTKYPKRR